VISELKGTREHYSIYNLCAAFGYTRQAWYNHLKRTELHHFQQHIVLDKIQEIRMHLPMTGCIKLYKELNNGFLQAVGISMGRDAVFSLLRSNGMLIKTKKKWVRTTDSFHRYRVHPDLVQRRPATQAEQIWVSDITYLRTTTGFTYLSLVTDAFSRKIVGYHLASNLKAIGCIKALKNALNSRLYPERILIHHSDRGTQYCCDDYVKLLKDNNINISMTQSGSPYDNALAERVNGILKIEFDLERTFKSLTRATAVVGHAIDKYNNLRLHASCNFKTPEYTHMLAKITEKQQKTEAIALV
jgi:putative transposase